MSGKHRKQPKRNMGKFAAVGAMALSPLLVPGSATAQDWDELAQCESSGNWSIDTGNGFSGGLQFTPSTWASFGGEQYAANAKDATREQQIAVAEQVLAVQGSGAWPGCTEKTNWTNGTSSESASVQSEASAEVEATAESSGGSASVSGAASGTYEVQAGDTLSEVALQAGVSVESVVSANNSVTDPHVIYPGQMLQLS